MATKPLSRIASLMFLLGGCSSRDLQKGEDTDATATGGDDAYGFGDLGEDPNGSGESASSFLPSEFGIDWLLPSIDWRDVGNGSFVTDVKDQGRSGTCVLFASAAAMESSYLIQSDVEADMSEQYLLDCTNATVNGYYLSSVAEDWKNVGTVDEADAPYRGLTDPSTAEQSCASHASLSPTYRAIEAYRLSSAEEIKAALHLGPVLTRFTVYGNFTSYDDGIYEVGSSSATSSGHAVAIVGYDDDEGYWIVKNSWSSSWGEDGYVRVAYGQPSWESEAYWFKIDGADYTRGLELLDYDEFCEDEDGDHYGDGDNCSGEDCDDQDPYTNDGASERCDEVDNDCDGEVDEGVTNTYYLDADGDGYGNPSYTFEGCSTEPGWVPTATDCDDGTVLTHPGANETCDAADNDCDGFSDEGFDTDGDGYTTCEGDCDDTDDGVFGGGNEQCEDGIDQDCDGADCVLLDDCDDLDHDNYGVGSGCLGPDPDEVGVDANGDGDCDDDGDVCGWEIHPGAAEACDGVDNDIDGDIDEGVKNTYFLDADGDGEGDASVTAEACTLPAGYATNDLDCDDSTSTVNSTAEEACDLVDNDCDGAVDEGMDVDMDGWSICDGDCDDASVDAYPGAADVCGDGIDNDCDGTADGGCGLRIESGLLQMPPATSTTQSCVDVAIPAGATDAIAFLAPMTVIEHSDDQCDFRSDITRDEDKQVFTFCVTLEHCGNGSSTLDPDYPWPYGFEAQAVVAATTSGDGWVQSFEVDLDDPSNSEAVPSASFVQTESICAVGDFDNNGDVDGDYTCDASFDASTGELTGTISEDYGNGMTLSARIVGLGTSPNMTVERQDFDCSNNGGSATVTYDHPVSDALGDDHLALMFPYQVDTGSDDHFSYHTRCDLVSTGGVTYNSCAITCYGSGEGVSGYFLFLDGDLSG